MSPVYPLLTDPQVVKTAPVPRAAGALPVAIPKRRDSRAGRPGRPVFVARAAALVAAGLVLAAGGCRKAEPLPVSKQAAALDAQIDWRNARLIAVQDGNRYKTLDSLARESMAALTGSEHLPGLSPLASLFELLFRHDAYVDTPIVKIRGKAMRADLSTRLSQAQRARIMDSGMMTPNELRDPSVQQRLRELEPRNIMVRAVQKVRRAETIAWFLDQLVRIVPTYDPAGVAPWHTPRRMLASASNDFLEQAGVSRAAIIRQVGEPVPGVSPDEAAAVFAPWLTLADAWQRGDAAAVQTRLDQLAAVLPTMAAPGTYPSRSQRDAEARYYAMGKLTWGWALYFVGMLASVMALVTRWRTPWIAALVFLLAGLGVHAYGIGLRWYIVGRIPVANMFEAVVFSAWVGIVVALVAELWSRRSIFLLAANATGFLSLVVGQFVIPGGGSITFIMGILDDLMLRIHTVLIIASYALIFLAAIIAIVYLVGYAAWRHRGGGDGGEAAPVPRGPHRPAAGTAAGEAPPPAASAAGGRGALCRETGGAPAYRLQSSGPAAGGAVAVVVERRPLMAGAAPGDEGRAAGLPEWLNYIDWCHLIILNLAFVMLFVGIILGAVWADYSWGRPWGWDPKEVFAMNTWIVYAILIHMRFVVRRRGLWTAWLSIAGCLMMAFNWCFVNFFIVGLHSYA